MSDKLPDEQKNQVSRLIDATSGATLQESLQNDLLNRLE